MSQNAALFLKANGSDVQGESSETSFGRENAIEVTWFEMDVITARESGTGMATGRRQYKPLMFRKKIDKASPLILKALVNNEAIEATFKFYRPNPTGDGTTEQYYTIVLKEGRIATFNQISPDSTNPGTATLPEQETVGIVFHTIIQTYMNGGVEVEDNWREGK